jgi:hypothetical protein
MANKPSAKNKSVGKKNSVGSKRKSSSGTSSNIYLFCFLLLVVSLTMFNMSLYLSSKKVKTRTADAEIVYETTYWEELLNNHPDYFPGWLELAKLEYANGKADRAHEALVNARKINPNSQELKTMEYILYLSQNSNQ